MYNFICRVLLCKIRSVFELNDCMCVCMIVFLLDLQGEKRGWCQACPLLSVWVTAGRGWGLHVLPCCGRLWLAVILLSSHIFFGAGAAQQRATQNSQTGCCPSDKQGWAKLIPAQETRHKQGIRCKCWHKKTYTKIKDKWILKRGQYKMDKKCIILIIRYSRLTISIHISHKRSFTAVILDKSNNY